jgi:LDH2 family malate/lactate/ureidoglycolate dehydrogenase
MEKNITYPYLFDFTEQVFLKVGCTPEHAKLATETLISADLRGIDSHGVARLSGYIRLWEAKRINAIPDIKVSHETPSTTIHNPRPFTNNHHQQAQTIIITNRHRSSTSTSNRYQSS